MTEPKKERCGACTDGYITFVTDDGHLSLRTCRKCGGYGYVDIKPLTNEEYLRSLNTEQLAEALLNIMANNEFTLYLLHTEKKSVQEMKDAVVEWLKQPHTKKE